mmetsp:Transcript_63334/g.151096  ORF Transcript_63334/g.151096 Transcript_63334/m.151096 type:complete len:397 (-) Transcript_63334:176-1366(-)|eukprot:CAMPEP_0178423158 /NCGR_PEP_ID=MMETSP0689_2-20121128/27545_1 /TAXON_ID=160604 /ORGANISM="Amphidinium massartii, Strain CS-259" /LENGTH=396 /DNA_ID=CAMNT_0020044745 /DNA_START=53 /DNA_END=1243 /DNA_ORIENTATION=-
MRCAYVAWFYFAILDLGCSALLRGHQNLGYLKGGEALLESEVGQAVEGSVELAAAMAVAVYGTRFPGGNSSGAPSAKPPASANGHSILEVDSELYARRDEEDSLPGGMTSEQYHYLQNSKDMVWIFGAYHKTGTELCLSIIHAFHGNNSVYWTTVEMHHQSKALFRPEPFHNFYFNPNMDVIRAAARHRLVHFVRDPVNIVTSAYRYHMQALEKWLLLPVKKATQDRVVAHNVQLLLKWGPCLSAGQKQALHRYKQSVDGGMTLVEYYQSVPEEEGVIVEALRSWPEIELLLSNYNATRHDSNILQMYMESIQASYPKAMRCMFEFLQESAELDIKGALRKVLPLDVSKHPDQAGGGAGHVTVGKFNNTLLTDVLLKVEHMKNARRVLRLPAARQC